MLKNCVRGNLHTEFREDELDGILKHTCEENDLFAAGKNFVSSLARGVFLHIDHVQN